MLSRVFVLLCLLYSGIGQAAEISTISALEASENYIIKLTAEVEIPERFVREVLLDPGRVQRLNPSIVSVDILESDMPGILRFRDQTKMCVLFFCVDYKNVLRLQALKNGDIRLDIEPEHSEFHSGHVVWKTRKIDAANTHIEFYSESVPSFWVPPFIGTSLMESRMADVIHEMLLRMECEYRDDKDCKLDIIEDSTSL